MKKIFNLFTPIAILLTLTSCNNVNTSSSSTESNVESTNASNIESANTSDVSSTSEASFVDYTSNFERNYADFDNNVKLFETVTVKNYVDGDTTHFNSNLSYFKGGLVAARYNGVDTPESTGQVEPWGKYASNFTKGKLSAAKSIIMESDSTTWNTDSNGRYLLWIWYQDATTNKYRLLNLELVQEGLSVAKSFSNYTYGDTLQLAYYQAQQLKIRVAGKETDPDYYYGDAYVITIKELRTNIENYVNKKVRVEGLITRNAENTYYAEDFDVETNRSYGIQIYAGYTSYEFLKVGNRVSACGTITYYETGGTYQLSDLKYYPMRPNHKDNLKLIEENVEVNPTTITYAEVIESYCATYVKLENLKVKSVYTTTAESSSSQGAMTLTCEDASGNTVKVRTSVLYEEDGKTMITENAFNGKTIDCVGIVDAYSGSFQVHVFLYSDFTIK